MNLNRAYSAVVRANVRGLGVGTNMKDSVRG